MKKRNDYFCSTDFFFANKFFRFFVSCWLEGILVLLLNDQTRNGEPIRMLLASVETGASSGLFVRIGLETQRGTALRATGESLIDHSVASGFDVVGTTADVVVATDLNFLGRVGGSIVHATPFVLDRGGTFDPGASEFTFDASLALTSHGANVVLVSVDGAFEDDIVLRVTITVVQTFSVGDATAGLQREGLASALAAVEPELAIFDGFTSGQGFAVLDASGLDQLGTTADGFLTFVDGIVLVGFLLQRHAFATIDASLDDGDHRGLGIGGIQLAKIETAAIVEIFASLVLLTVGDATGGFEAQTVTRGLACTTVFTIVVVTTDRDTGKIFGDASLGNNAASLAHVDQTAAFDFGTLGVSAGATTAGLGRQGHGNGHEAQDQQSDQLHDDDDEKID